MTTNPSSDPGLWQTLRTLWEKFRCRHGHHKMNHRDWPLGAGKHPACVCECSRCGVVEDWAGAWDSVVCIGRWPSYDAFMDEHSPHRESKRTDLRDLRDHLIKLKLETYALLKHPAHTSESLDHLAAARENLRAALKDLEQPTTHDDPKTTRSREETSG